MLHDYSPKTFLRQTPNKILKEYFEGKNLLEEVDFDALGEMDPDPIMEALDKLSDEQRRDIEADFRLINEMATESGVRVLVEEAESPFHKLDVSRQFRQMKNHYERAFWLFLKHGSVFHVAVELARMDRVGSWRLRFVGANRDPAVKEEDRNNLVSAISEIYRKQGRGHHCHVDNYLRQNPERHCYFTYPEDYATTDMGYDKSGKFRHWPRKPAFEVIFVYKPENGFLEVRAKGKRDEVRQLQKAFCQTILGLDEMPDDESRYYDLSPLKDKNFSFVTDPEDCIEKTTIKLVRLDLPGFGSRRITLEASHPKVDQPIHGLIEKAINKANVPLDQALLAKAKLQVLFAPRDGKRCKTLTFEISVPDRCTLKDDPLDQIAKKYIERWGLISK